MKQYLTDLVVAMWKPVSVSIIAATGIWYGANKHWYIFMSACAIIFACVMCAWGPWCEEKFKAAHCSTKAQALLFGVIEFTLYSWQISASPVVFLICRLPTLMLHSASSLCYYHYNNNRMRWFWFINHSAWNTVACASPVWLYKLSGKMLVPSALTICVTLFWTTVFMFKLFRKKQVVVCQ